MVQRCIKKNGDETILLPGVVMAEFESVLPFIFVHERADNFVARINSSPRFNMPTVFVTRDSLYRVAGYGSAAQDRYLDDQLNIILMFLQ